MPAATSRPLAMPSAARYACDSDWLCHSLEREADRLLAEAGFDPTGEQRAEIEAAEAASVAAEAVLLAQVDEQLEWIEERVARRGSLSRRQLLELRRELEEIEPKSDEQMDRAEAALEAIEPIRVPPGRSSEALSREAVIALYGARYDAGEELYHPQDARQRQNRPTQNDTDLRCGTLGEALDLHAVAVIQRDGGRIELLGADRREARPSPARPVEHPLRIR